MVEFNVAFDNKDSESGIYFEKCRVDLLEFLEENFENYSIHEIHSNLCNQVYLETRMSQINQINFIFIAYSHGKDRGLVANQSIFVEVDTNTNLFVNSFFYTVACSAGKILGKNLIDGGTLSFIGYKEDIEVFTDEHQPLSVKCDNHGIKMFILGKTIGESFDLMKNYYTQQIDKLNQFGDYFAASSLVASRESLVLFGDRNLVIGDFAHR